MDNFDNLFQFCLYSIKEESSTGVDIIFNSWIYILRDSGYYVLIDIKERPIFF
jgi:hypothetical protein